tara:strand:+ start:2339 stop:3520 length:1182 start_codon:yes stop_codon:yes gene_type:complete
LASQREIIKACLNDTSPRTTTGVPWTEIESALVIIFTSKNTGDLHYDVRASNGYNPGSNKTHIDITSGGDIAPGLSPATDFFVVSKKKVKVPVLLNQANIEDISGSKLSSSDWITNLVTVNTLQPRNDSQNPSIQLLEKTDIEEIRLNQEIGDSLIFLKKLNGEILALGTKTTKDLQTIMGGKTKRIFRFAPATHRPVVVPSEIGRETESSTESTQSKSKGRNKNSGLGRSNNPALNSAIENHGANLCEKFFAGNGYSVTDVSKPNLAIKMGLVEYPGFDQLACKGGVNLGIEIKSTTTRGQKINISSNELTVAVADKDWRLCVVSDIEVIDLEQCKVTGGAITIYKVSKREKLTSLIEEITESITLAEIKGLIVLPSYSINLGSDIFEETEI